MTKALVVDANELNLELSLDILTSQGFYAEGAKDSEDALRKVEKNIFDIVFMEVRLPGISGIDVRNIIKSKPEYLRVPVIALTADALDGDRERFLSKGFDDYISKPIDYKHFIKKLGKYKVISMRGMKG